MDTSGRHEAKPDDTKLTKEIEMENVMWTRGQFGAELMAEVDGHIVELFIDEAENDVKASIVVDGKFSTDSTQDWSDVEKVFPRTYWPAPIYRGKAFENKERLAPAALVQAIEDARANLLND